MANQIPARFSVVSLRLRPIQISLYRTTLPVLDSLARALENSALLTAFDVLTSLERAEVWFEGALLVLQNPRDLPLSGLPRRPLLPFFRKAYSLEMPFW